MDTEEMINLIIIILIMYESLECLKVMSAGRQCWVSPSCRDRDTQGFFALKFDEMYNNAEEFHSVVRMTKEVFDLLFRLLEEALTKNSNRPSIPAKCRLFLTLVYLAHGGSKKTLSDAFKMGLTSVKKIVNETCDVIWDNLAHIYLPIPTTAEWKSTADDFNMIWNLPNCVGAIDGKHITIDCSNNAGSLVSNVKGKHYIILLGACDANYTFTGMDIGEYAANKDGGVLWYSSFGENLFQGNLALPEDEALPNSNMQFPYCFVGNAALPLKTFIMRPYPGRNLPPDRENFNKHMSRARNIIENAFGILAARWRILLAPLKMSIQSAEKVVRATIVLHNFIKSHDATYIPPEYCDRYDGDNVIEGLWRKDTTPLKRAEQICSNNASKTAFQLRDQLKSYLYLIKQTN